MSTNVFLTKEQSRNMKENKGNIILFDNKIRFQSKDLSGTNPILTRSSISRAACLDMTIRHLLERGVSQFTIIDRRSNDLKESYRDK